MESPIEYDPSKMVITFLGKPVDGFEEVTIPINGVMTEVTRCPACKGRGETRVTVIGKGYLLEVGKAYHFTEECSKCYGEKYLIKED